MIFITSYPHKCINEYLNLFIIKIFISLVVINNSNQYLNTGKFLNFLMNNNFELGSKQFFFG